LRIRKAELRDVPAIFDLINNFARERVMLPRTIADLYENVWSFTVAEEAGQVVGCGALKFYNQELAEIRSLCVEPGRASHGVGTALVERLLDDADGYGLRNIFALTLVPAFFRKCGFRETRREKFPLKISQDCARCDLAACCSEKTVTLDLAARRARRTARRERITVQPAAAALAN
jgi:amino-acid N-acetyltransferase